MNGWYGRARSTARCGTRALCSSLIRGARCDPCDVASGRCRDLDSVLATVIHLRRDNVSTEHRKWSRLSSRAKALTVCVRKRGSAVCRVRLRFVRRASVTRLHPAERESSDVGSVHDCAGGT